MKRIKVFTLLMTIALSFVSIASSSAQSVRYDDFRIINRSLAVGKKKSTKADSCAWVEIGDTSSAKGLLLNATDTGKVFYKRKPGLLIYRLADSSLYIHTGTRWKKITSS